MMKLSIIIPVFNEERYIKELVRRVRAADIGNIEKEIIIVDDCSNDNTRDILKKDIEPVVDRVIYKDKNEGKGAALKTGFRFATGDIIVVQDADLEYNPSDYRELLRPFLEKDADIVYGSRFRGDTQRRVISFWHYMVNRFLTLVSNITTNLNLTDMETCYKMFKREVIESINLKQNRFGFEPEFTAKISKGNWKIYEVGISYDERKGFEGKKIGWKDGINALYCIFRYWLFD